MPKIFIFLILVFFQATFAMAGNQLGFDQKLQENISFNFKDGGQFSETKIYEYKENILQRKYELSHIIINYESKLKKEDVDEVREELAESDTLFTYDLMLSYLEKMRRSVDFIEQNKLAREILVLDFATKVTGTEPFGSRIVEIIKHFPGPNTISKKVGKLGEASNLYNVEKDEYYSQEELIDLKKTGLDISTLNPGRDSSFWYERDISNSDVKDIIHGKSTLLYDGLNIQFPSKKGKFKKLRTTQSKPKIDIKFKVEDPITGEKKNRTFKLKIGSEMHGEITAAGLLGSLGYHTDLSKYVRDFKVTLPEGMSIEDLKKEWYSYDKFKSFEINDLVNEIGIDDKGRTYLVFIEALIETKPEELKRIGPWGFGSHGNQGKREVRGLHLFNIWVANNDVKEADNNKLVLKKTADGSYQSYQYMHDIGFTFGHIYREKPQSFRWKVVTKNSSNEIKFDYLAFQPNSGFEHVTINDAKWMVRQIGQLSRKQIKHAVDIGGWPKDIEKLLVEKLISRRNDLVKNFDLEPELGTIEFDREITTQSGQIQNGNVVNENFSGYTQRFGSEVGDLIGPVGSTLEKLIIQGARQLTKVIDSVVIGADTLGIDSDLVAEVELDIERQIIVNPSPAGINDNFIVQDTFRVRYALGAGIIVRGKGAYYQEFKLLYPVQTYEEGMYHDKFIFNALLPRTIKSGRVPEHYVMMVHQGIEGEGEILLGTNTIGVSAGISFTKGRMSGSIVSKSPGEYTVMRDTTSYNKLMGRIYAELFVLRIPVLEKTLTKGLLFRNSYRVDYSEDDDELKEYKLESLKDFIRTGRFDAIENFGENTELVNNYVTKRLETKLFFYNFNGEKRVDTIERIRNKGTDKERKENIYQIEILKEQAWNVFGGGEIKTRQFRFKGDVDEDGNIDEPLLDIKLLVQDDSTSTKELRDSYIKSINQLALSDDFIRFTPELFTRNNLWGINHVSLRMMYDKESIETLIQTDENKYYDVMAESSNRDADFWKRSSRDDLVDRKSSRLKRKFKNFVNAMKKAKKQVSDKKKYKIVIEAFNNLITQKSHAFEVILLQRIHRVLGRDNYFFEGHITIPDSNEMRYPEKTPLYNVMNPEIFLKQRFIEFDFDEVIEAWQLFF